MAMFFLMPNLSCHYVKNNVTKVAYS